MSKLKVHSGASKRFKNTGAGLKRKKANKSHILTKMKTKRKRQLRGTTQIAKGDQQLVDKMLKTNATKIALDRKSRSFRVVFAALSVFFFIFSAEGALDEEKIR